MMIEVEVEVVDDFVNLLISNEKVHENIMSGIYQFIDKGTWRFFCKRIVESSVLISNDFSQSFSYNCDQYQLNTTSKKKHVFSNVPQFSRNIGEATLSTVKRHICGNYITGIMLSSFTFKRRELFYFSLSKLDDKNLRTFPIDMDGYVILGKLVAG
ncbi:hypothetical protein GC102_05825 [Paenibacillus sp. LMG 31460]|uniref:Uncharacterized protein n=1 Tax=Paenibacillus germinis TaxID=2654979 RepID=A0ABX1YWB2_9BACL|nr:hypothetical protein [Paenibacillus germinis]NOU85302.1 hypothetical protein [Paenibacillus germinis]